MGIEFQLGLFFMKYTKMPTEMAYFCRQVVPRFYKNIIIVFNEIKSKASNKLFILFAHNS